MSNFNQDELYAIVGGNIKKARKGLGMSQSNLSAVINLSRTSVVNIEQGRQHPSLFLLWQISNALKVNISDLLPDNTSEKRNLHRESPHGTILERIKDPQLSENLMEKLRNLTERIINPDHEPKKT